MKRQNIWVRKNKVAEATQSSMGSTKSHGPDSPATTPRSRTAEATSSRASPKRTNVEHGERADPSAGTERGSAREIIGLRGKGETRDRPGVGTGHGSISKICSRPTRGNSENAVYP